MYENATTKMVLLEITNRCNLKCKHCFNSTYREQENEIVFMPIEKIKYTIEKCLSYGLSTFFISGGEPFLHPDIISIIELCGQYPEVFFTLTTNGLLLDEKIINAIEKNENIGIQMSLDSLDQTVYEEQRGFGTYLDFRNALNLLVKSKIRIRLARTCVTAININEVPDIYDYCVNNNITPSFLFVDKMGNACKNWQNLSLALSQKLKVINIIIEKNKQYNRSVTVPEPVSSCNFTAKVDVKALMVKYTGDIAPCQYYYQDSIGNIFNNTIEEILNYDNLKRYYEEAEKRKNILMNSAQCKDCTIHAICSYGCMGLAMLNGNEAGYDGLCEYRTVLSAMYSAGLIDLPQRKVNRILREGDAC